MSRPRWERLEEWARTEASRSLDLGLDPHPALVFFEGEEPTLYVRGGARYERAGPDDQALRWNELFGLGMVIHPERAAVVTPTRIRTDSDGALAGEAEGEMGVFVGWARRRDGTDPEQGGVVLTYGLDDRGSPSWGDRYELADSSPLRTHLDATVTGRWRADDGDQPYRERIGMTPAGALYALTRFGLTVGVAPDWYARYGFDEPLPPGDVRPEDRRRAQRRWRADRPTTEVGS